MKRVGLLPTLVTMANAYCGLLAIYKANDGKFSAAAFLILLAMVFDVFDGMVARLSGTTSPLGAQLDSLSDAISFGVAPAFLVKVVVEAQGPWFYTPKLLTLLTAVFALGAILRLARYNVEHAAAEGSDRAGKEVASFAGIPTPGAAGALAALVFLASDENALLDYWWVLACLPILCFGLGFVMISRIRYVHFGSRFLQGRRGFGYLFVVIVVIAVLTRFPEELLALGFLCYALSGPVMTPFRGRGPGAKELDEVEIPEGL